MWSNSSCLSKQQHNKTKRQAKQLAVCFWLEIIVARKERCARHWDEKRMGLENGQNVFLHTAFLCTSAREINRFIPKMIKTGHDYPSLVWTRFSHQTFQMKKAVDFDIERSKSDATEMQTYVLGSSDPPILVGVEVGAIYVAYFRATEAQWWGDRCVTLSITLKVRRSEGGWSRQGWFLHCRIVSSGNNLYSSLRCINGYRRHIIWSTLGKHFMHGGGGGTNTPRLL